MIQLSVTEDGEIVIDFINKSVKNSLKFPEDTVISYRVLPIYAVNKFQYMEITFADTPEFVLRVKGENEIDLYNDLKNTLLNYKKTIPAFSVHASLQNISSLTSLSVSGIEGGTKWNSLLVRERLEQIVNLNF